MNKDQGELPLLNRKLGRGLLVWKVKEPDINLVDFLNIWDVRMIIEWMVKEFDKLEHEN